jgi:hypothetical protein
MQTFAVTNAHNCHEPFDRTANDFPSKKNRVPVLYASKLLRDEYVDLLNAAGIEFDDQYVD